MAQRRHHYERAFEWFLRSRRIPYVAVDEARRALLPPGAAAPGDGALKSFDFVIYGDAGANLLVDIKGRRVGRRAARGAGRAARLESWVTLDDVESLRRWQGLFGPGFQSVFVFVYWCDAQPPDALFQEVFEHRSAWYALRAVALDAYAGAMKVRSPRWGTVDVPRDAFERLSQPFAPPAGPRPHPHSHPDVGPVEPALATP